MTAVPVAERQTPRWTLGFSGRTIAAPASLSPMLRGLLIAAIVSIVFLSRFGINIGGFSLGLSLVAQYLIVAYLVLRSSARVTPGRVVLFLSLISVGAVSLALNPSSSATSLYLFAAIYLPFIFTGDFAEAPAAWLWLAERFSALVLILALFGIAQFFLQFVYHPRWLFDFSYLIPDAIRASGRFNTVISTGLADKANGFFMREPSAFSQLLGLAVIIEISTFKRMGRMAVLCMGLVLSYSGTGLILVAIALLFPIAPRTLLRAAVVAGVGFIAVFALSQVLDLSYTLNRAGEFGSQGSSGFARFVAPGYLVADRFFSEVWTPFLGNGPGSILRVIQQVTRTFETHDPTWAKLLFEYGLTGFILMMAFVGLSVGRCIAPAEIRAGLFVGWLVLGGLLLSPDMTGRMFLLCTLWPLQAIMPVSQNRSGTTPMQAFIQPPATLTRSRPGAGTGGRA